MAAEEPLGGTVPERALSILSRLEQTEGEGDNVHNVDDVNDVMSLKSLHVGFEASEVGVRESSFGFMSSTATDDKDHRGCKVNKEDGVKNKGKILRYASSSHQLHFEGGTGQIRSGNKKSSSSKDVATHLADGGNRKWCAALENGPWWPRRPRRGISFGAGLLHHPFRRLNPFFLFCTA